MRLRKILFSKVLAFLRTRLLAAVLMPALIGGAYSAKQGYFSLARFALILLGLVIAELLNLFGTDYISHTTAGRRGEEKPLRLPGNPVLSPTILRPEKIIFLIVFLGIAGLGVLAVLNSIAGPFVLVFLSLAAATGFLYVFNPFPYSFLSTSVLPPVISAGVYFILSGELALEAALAGLPIAWISVAVILGYRVLYTQTDSGISPAHRRRKGAVLLIYLLCPLSIAVLYINGIYSPLPLLAIPVSLLFVYVIFRILRDKSSDHIPATATGVLMHSVTSLIIALCIMA